MENRVDLVVFDEIDWVAIYVNGKLIAEGEGFSEGTLLRLIAPLLNFTVETTIMDDDVLHNGVCSPTLDEMKARAAAQAIDICEYNHASHCYHDCHACARGLYTCHGCGNILLYHQQLCESCGELKMI